MPILFLAGQPNCGKSSIFNLLTGKHTRVGNRFGVTVEKTTAILPFLAKEKVYLCDLPGIRSPSPVSEDEKVAFSALKSDPSDGILAVLDATNLQNALPLLRFLFELSAARRLPLAILLNFCDLLPDFPRKTALESLLDVPIFPISARSGRGLAELTDLLKATFRGEKTRA